MKIDVRAVLDLLGESRDLHADAVKGVRATLPELADVGATRRRVLAGAGGVLVAGVLATPAGADTALDVQIVQTASSLEALAVATYGIVLGQGPEATEAPAYQAVAGLTVKTARDAVTAFAMETMRQHAEHMTAFQAHAAALDRNAKVQDAPNPKFLPALRSADLSTVDKLLDFAALIEKVATDTYVSNLSLLQDQRTKAVMASVMGVEAQHLATLRTMAALLKGGAEPLVAVPFPLGNLRHLPQAAGTAATPDALHMLGGPELLAEPASGALG